MAPRFVLICVTSWWGIICKLQYEYNFWTIWAPYLFLFVWPPGEESYVNYNTNTTFEQSGPPYLLLFVWPPGEESYVSQNTNTTFEQSGTPICSYLCDLLVTKHINFTIQMQLSITLEFYLLWFVWLHGDTTYVIYNTNATFENSGALFVITGVTSWWQNICNLQYKSNLWDLRGSICSYLCDLLVTKHMWFTIQMQLLGDMGLYLFSFWYDTTLMWSWRWQNFEPKWYKNATKTMDSVRILLFIFAHRLK